jgi:hypothetical protein
VPVQLGPHAGRDRHHRPQHHRAIDDLNPDLLAFDQVQFLADGGWQHHLALRANLDGVAHQASTSRDGVEPARSPARAQFYPIPWLDHGDHVGGASGAAACTMRRGIVERTTTRPAGGA